MRKIIVILNYPKDILLLILPRSMFRYLYFKSSEDQRVLEQSVRNKVGLAQYYAKKKMLGNSAS